MSMPFYVSPEQLMKDRADFARKGISRGRSVVAVQYADGVLFASENPSQALHKVSEIYDRIAFAAVGRYNEFENLRIAGVRLADMRGYAYDRRDVTGRGLANAYAQTLGTIFSSGGEKPYEVELFVAEIEGGVGRRQQRRQQRRAHQDLVDRTEADVDRLAQRDQRGNVALEQDAHGIDARNRRVEDDRVADDVERAAERGAADRNALELDEDVAGEPGDLHLDRRSHGGSAAREQQQDAQQRPNQRKASAHCHVPFPVDGRPRESARPEPCWKRRKINRLKRCAGRWSWNVAALLWRAGSTRVRPARKA